MKPNSISLAGDDGLPANVKRPGPNVPVDAGQVAPPVARPDLELPTAKPDDKRVAAEAPKAKPGDEHLLGELPLAKPSDSDATPAPRVPRALVDFATDEALKNYVVTGNLGAALNLTRRSVAKHWSVERGSGGIAFKRIERPFDSYRSPSSRGRETPKAPPDQSLAAAAEVPEVAEARRRWDEAKASGDPDRMTRTANDLLRAVEKARAARRDDALPPEAGRDPIGEILNPQPLERRIVDAVGKAAGEVFQTGVDAIAGTSGHAANSDADLPPGQYAQAPDHPDDVASDADVPPGQMATVPDEGGQVDAASDAEVPPGRMARVGAGPAGVSAQAGENLHTGDGQPSAARFTDKDLRRAAGIIAQQPLARQKEMLQRFGEAYGRGELNRLAEYVQGSRGVASAAIPDDLQPSGGITEVAFARQDRGRVPRRDSSSDGPRDVHPDDPNAGMERVKRARRHGIRFEPSRGRKHWVDPTADWELDEIDETIRESGGREVTPELLLIFSNEAYPDNRLYPPEVRARYWRGRSDQPDGSVRGWEYLDGEKGKGYYGMAVYDPDTNTLVIANRGTYGWSDEDREADWAIIDGDDTPQVRRAQDLLVRAWRKAAARARREGRPPPRLVLTGHSLGGALAQVQLARVYADSEFRGVDARGVTFATLGGDKIVDVVLRKWRGATRDRLDQYANDRLINYYREGDGIILNRTKRGMPGRIGQDVVLAGIDMARLELDEFNLRVAINSAIGPPPLGPPRPDIAGLSKSVFDRHVENHSLLSYYHPDFSDPLDEVFERRRVQRH